MSIETVTISYAGTIQFDRDGFPVNVVTALNNEPITQNLQGEW